MAHQEGQPLVLGEEEARQAEERFAKLQEEFAQARERNQRLEQEMAVLREQAATEHLRGDRRSRAQAQDMAQLTAELIAGRGMAPMGMKVEKPEIYDGAKHRDVDTWLFQVEEHMALARVPAASHAGYAASLLRGNAAMWWRELCESGNRLNDWDEFKMNLRRQFRMDNLVRRARDDLYALRQREKEPVSDFLHKFRQVCIRINDLSEAEKLDKFLRALNTNVRMQVELKEPTTFEDAARFADRADNVLTRVSGQGTGGKSSWFKANTSQGGTHVGKWTFQQKTFGGPEPMEIGTSYVQRKPLTPVEKQHLRDSHGCFYCRKANAGHYSKNCPLKKNKNGGRQGNFGGR